MLRNLIILALVAVVLTLAYEVYFKKPPVKPDGPAAAKQEPPAVAPTPEKPPAPPDPAPPQKIVAPPMPAQRMEFGSRVLRKGMEGEDVRILQERLRLAGFVHCNFQDGCFDEATEKALIEYQRGTKFLKEMYCFPGVAGEPKPCADAALCRQLLEVPGRNKALVKYTIAKGDTLWRIASRFGVGPDSLTTLNNISDPSVVTPGNALFIICNSDKAP